MEKSKKTLKMIGICIIGLVIVVAVNMLKKPSDPFKASTNKLGYQHIEKVNLLDNPEEDGDFYYVYFYRVGNSNCEKVEDSIKTYARSHSAIYFVNMDEKSKDYIIGQKVKVTYTGDVRETYPAGVDAISVEIVNN